MSDYQFKLPDIGEGIHEGEIVSWLVAEGDEVEEDQDIVEVMTDKATVQISAPVSGTIASIKFQEGDTVNVGDVFVVIAPGGGGKAEADDEDADEAEASSKGGENGADKKEKKAEDEATEADGEGKEEKTLFDLPSEMTGSAGSRRPARERGASGSGGRTEVLAMPAVRAEAKKRGVDLATVKPTGSHGHITLADLDQAGKAPAAGAPPQHLAFDLPEIDRSDALEVEPLKGLRKAIARNMTKATTLQAHFTYVLEVRADKLVEMRSEAKALAEEEGVKLTYLPIITKAVVRALKKHPRLNAHIDEEAQELVLKKPVHMGIATQTEKGLVVPVVHDADKKTLLELAVAIDEQAEKGRNLKLSTEDITGGTFTTTSLGKIGGLLATPILAHPQVAIMGVHEIRDVPVVKNGEVVPGKVMNLAFTFDHRVIDGYDGALFANDVKKFLEEPSRLLLESV